MTRVITIEGAVLVQQVAFCDKTGIDVAVFQVNGLLSCVQNVWDLFAGVLAHGALEDEKVTAGKDDVAAGEGGVEAWLAVEDAGDLWEKISQCGKP